MRPQVIEHHHAPHFETRHEDLFNECHEHIAARATLNHEIGNHSIQRQCRDQRLNTSTATRRTAKSSLTTRRSSVQTRECRVRPAFINKD